ncbi:hypothetical protein B9Z55_000911 [Caenorhabditis nigoni]|nr:hypothetical protein B9Z55_000911 [Caenorhabditis nigoni]
MIPNSQQEKMRRNLPMKFSNMRQNSPDQDFNPFFDEYFYPHSRNVCSKHGELDYAQATPFQNEPTGLQNFGHGRAFVPGIPGFSSSEFSSLDMAKLQLQYLMMIQARNGMTSPPSTISSPLNTPHPFNTIAQPLNHCDAPEPNNSTDDFEGHGSNFKFNVSSRINSANGYYKNECGGKMHLRDGRFLDAHTDFFEAFKNYDESGSARRTTCLKYLVLANILIKSDINPFDSQEAKPFKNEPEMIAMTQMVQAYQDNDIQAFEQIMADHQ